MDKFCMETLQRDLTNLTQLKERRSKFGYKIVLYRSFEDLKKAISEMEKEKQRITILLWFGRKE